MKVKLKVKMKEDSIRIECFIHLMDDVALKFSNARHTFSQVKHEDLKTLSNELNTLCQKKDADNFHTVSEGSLYRYKSQIIAYRLANSDYKDSEEKLFLEVCIKNAKVKQEWSLPFQSTLNTLAYYVAQMTWREYEQEFMNRGNKRTSQTTTTASSNTDLLNNQPFPSILLKYFMPAKYKEAVRYSSPFLHKIAYEKAVGHFVPNNLQLNNPKPNEPSESQAMLDFFFEKIDNPSKDVFYLLMAGSGMGKSTNLINLYIRYQEQQHLNFFRPKFAIYLLPLSDPECLQAVQKISQPEKTVLLLDGLDESVKAAENKQEFINRIVQACHKFRLVIVSCRTHFFDSTEQEPNISDIKITSGGTGDKKYSFQKYFLSFFNDQQVAAYIKKKFKGNRKIQKAYLKKIKPFSDIKYRPFILANIEALDKEQYAFEADIYHDISKFWMEREGFDEQAQQIIHAFSMEISENMYLNRAQHNQQLYIHLDDISDYATRNKLPLSILDLQKNTFLYRYGNYFVFSHRSILEYFLAHRLIESLDFALQFDFIGMDNAETFFYELMWKTHTKEWLSLLNGTFSIPDKSSDIDLSEADSYGCLSLSKTRRLVLDNNNLSNLEGLRLFQQVDFLDLSNNQIKDISLLAHLKKVEDLNLGNNQISDFSPLYHLASLKSLTVVGNPLSYTTIESLKAHLPSCEIIHAEDSE